MADILRVEVGNDRTGKTIELQDRLDGWYFRAVLQEEGEGTRESGWRGPYHSSRHAQEAAVARLDDLEDGS